MLVKRRVPNRDRQKEPELDNLCRKHTVQTSSGYKYTVMAEAEEKTKAEPVGQKGRN